MEIMKHGDGQGEGKHTIVPSKRQPRHGLKSHGYVPKEIWVEILSRLPVKSLLICRSVCKSWRKIAAHLKKKIRSLPLCGLLIRAVSFKQLIEGKIYVTYICMKSKDTVSLQIDDSEDDYNDKLTGISSGYSKGWMGDLTFNFGALYTVSPSNLDQKGYFSAIHRGLLLVVLNDGTYQVHNPATKQVFVLPNSPTVEKFGVNSLEEAAGIIIHMSGSPVRTRFMVFRFVYGGKGIEFYYSHSISRRWRVYKTYREEANPFVGRSLVMGNYVGFSIKNSIYAFLLMGRNRIMAMKFDTHGRDDPTLNRYSFGLPEIVLNGYRNARLGECGGCLHLSYYSPNGGLWVWKRDGLTTGGAWVPLLEISSTRLSCQPVAREHLAKGLNAAAAGCVMPLGFHPDTAIVFLYAKSAIFAYDLINDTLDKIAEIKDHGDNTTSLAALPFVPSFCPLPPLMKKILRKHA